MSVRGLYPVWARAVWAVLDSAKHLGVDLQGVFEGLPFDAVSIRQLRRVDWEDYVELSERVMARAGGSDLAAAQIERCYPIVVHELRALAGAFVSPMVFVRFMHEMVTPAMFSSVVCSMEQLGQNSARLSIRLRPDACPSLAVFQATAGAIRAYPIYLRLPPAVVTGDVGPGHGVYEVLLPPSRTIPARLGRLLSERMSVSMVVGREADGSLLSATFGNHDDNDIERRLAAAIARWELSPRQSQVLERLAAGAANKEIASAIGCAENTVELHVTQLLRKSGMSSRAQLIARFWSSR